MRKPEDELENLLEQDLLRQLRVLDSPQGSEILLQGNQRLVNFSSNDYLGLANHDDLKSIYQDSISTYGVGSGASRLVCGTMQPHIHLEQQVAQLKHTESALTFSSGFAAASGTLSAIVGKQDIIILDKLCHASLIDGARLSGATIRVFPHNNLDKLESHLKWAADRGDPESRTLVVTESVFSMDGDLAPLAEITQLKQNYSFLLMVDEAHAFGVLGPEGRGAVADQNLESFVDFQMGTFSKAIGLSGGYIASKDVWIQLLINRARSFIYSTAPTPALANTISEALKLVCGIQGDQWRAQLMENIAAFDPQSSTPIIPVVIGRSQTALNQSKQLLSKGFLVPAIRYPTVPRDTARLRITLSANHNREDIAKLVKAVRPLQAD